MLATVRDNIMEIISNSTCSVIAIETLLNSKINLEKMTKFVKISGEHRHCGTLYMDSRNEEGKNEPAKPIEFVKPIQYSFGTVSLEDTSYPPTPTACWTSCETPAQGIGPRQPGRGDCVYDSH